MRIIDSLFIQVVRMEFRNNLFTWHGPVCITRYTDYALQMGIEPIPEEEQAGEKGREGKRRVGENKLNERVGDRKYNKQSIS